MFRHFSSFMEKIKANIDSVQVMYADLPDSRLHNIKAARPIKSPVCSPAPR